MKRYDWVRRLYDAIETAEGEPFAWGKNDCCLFTARVVDAMCDTDYAMRLKKKYRGKPSAEKYIKSFGGLRPAVESWLGVTQPLSYTKRGDVVLFDNGGQHTLGISVGDGVVSTGETGPVRVSMTHAICSWAVR